MADEELRAKIVARAKLKISRSQVLAILESVTLLEYIEELEAAQPSVKRTAVHRDDCAVNVGMLGECDCGAED